MNTREIDFDRLQAMRKEWVGVLEERSKTVLRLKADLVALQSQGKQADIGAVLAFYEKVLDAGKAAGTVIVLEDFITKLRGPGESKRNKAAAPEADEEFHL
jgi:hypothetical protein